jgi:hypothetical protein
MLPYKSLIENFDSEARPSVSSLLFLKNVKELENGTLLMKVILRYREAFAIP